VRDDCCLAVRHIACDITPLVTSSYTRTLSPTVVCIAGTTPTRLTATSQSSILMSLHSSTKITTSWVRRAITLSRPTRGRQCVLRPTHSPEYPLSHVPTYTHAPTFSHAHSPVIPLARSHSRVYFLTCRLAHQPTFPLAHSRIWPLAHFLPLLN